MACFESMSLEEAKKMNELLKQEIQRRKDEGQSWQNMTPFQILQEDLAFFTQNFTKDYN